MAVIVAVASLAIHGVFAAVVEVRDAGFRNLGETSQQEEAEKTAAAAAEEPTCKSNAALAATARAGFCASPMSGPSCWRELDLDFDAWIAECDALVALQEQEEEDARRRDEPVRIALLDDAALEKLEPIPIMPLLEKVEQKKFEEQQKQELAEKAEEAKRQQEVRVASGQVVEITQPTVEKTPDRARFVSEFDSYVEKETVARGTTEKMIERPGPKELPVADRQKLPTEPQPPQQKELAEQKKPDFENERGTGKLDMRKPGEKPVETPIKKITPGDAKGSKDPLAENGLAPRFGQERRRIDARRPTEIGEGGEAGERGRPKVPDLRPSEELISRVVGGGSVDKLDGVEDGERTALNSKRWKYASFFNRLKRQVAQNWHPNEVYLQRDPRGNVYGVKDRITVVQVELREDGSLAKIHVQRGSGVQFLDEEAVRAFRAAQPFPNPPGGLVDRESKLISFSFGFHFQIGGDRGRWKIFRYR